MAATVYIPSKFQQLAERLAKTSTDDVKKPIFSTYMHLLVFAAMVGHSENEKRQLDAKERGAEIYDYIFGNNQLDGVAYLLALQEEQDGDILREKREAECWKIIESYAARGFEVINNWMIDNPGDIQGTDTILNQIKRIAKDLVEDKSNDDFSDVKF